MTDAGFEPGRAPGLPRRRVGRACQICIAVIAAGTLLSLVLRWLVPLTPMGFAVGYFDDGLFQRSAVALANSNWLGPFDVVTLAKGPSYPAFVAVTGRLGVPLQVGEQLVYLLAAGCIAISFWLSTHRRVAATVIYLILAFDPVNFAPQARVLRDNVYAGLSLLFLGSLLLTGLCLLRRTRLRWPMLLAPLTGLSGAAFWLCREEGIWIIPSTVAIVLGLSWIGLAERRRRTVPPRSTVQRSRRAAAVAAVMGIVAVTFWAPIATVGAKNERTYGVNLTTDFASGTFPAAYAAWSRVRGVPLRQYVPIDKAQREAVYPVSPAARELRSFLEDPANGWIHEGCASLNVCDDFAGGWAPWALRHAATVTGHFGSERDFQAFFGRLADEINDACDAGRLDCSIGVPPAVQPLLRASPLLVAQSVGYWLVQLPVNPAYTDSSLHLDAKYQVSAAERAALQQTIVGVPSSDEAAAVGIARYGSYQWVYTALGWLFRVLFLLLLAMAVLGIVLGSAWRRERPGNWGLWVLSVSLGLGIAGRLVLFAVLETTQYAIDPRYHYPTRTFLLVLATIGAANLFSVLRARRGRGHRAAGDEPAAALTAEPDVQVQQV